MSPQYDQFGNPIVQPNGIPYGPPVNGMGNGGYSGPPMTMTPGNNGQMTPGNQSSMGTPQPTPWSRQGWREFTPVPSTPPVPPLRGRLVGDISEITPQDVPMDGSPSFFPSSDYTCIFMKVWDSNGTIKTFRFIPELEVTPVTQESGTKDVDKIFAQLSSNVNTRLDAFEKRLNDILSPFTETPKKEEK